MNINLLSYFLPAELLEHFTVIGVKELNEPGKIFKTLHIELEEKNELPKGYDRSKYEAKDFIPGKLIQDFPIRGKSVYFVIKRRRWRNKENHSEIISSDYSFLSGGTKLTKELSDFLKDTGRDPNRRY